jgi:hypothetical protein
VPGERNKAMMNKPPMNPHYPFPGLSSDSSKRHSCRVLTQIPILVALITQRSVVQIHPRNQSNHRFRGAYQTAPLTFIRVLSAVHGQIVPPSRQSCALDREICWERIFGDALHDCALHVLARIRFLELQDNCGFRKFWHAISGPHKPYSRF